MSVVRGYLNGGNFYSNVAKPIDINLNFIVDHTNGNGLGIRSLKSNGYVRNVFMNTNQTPGSNDGYTNPNPAAGFAWIQLKNNFNYYLGGFSGFVSQTTGSATSTTSGNAYVIRTLGTTTLAQWQTAGLPPGFTPTVGQAFVAKATGAIGGTGTVTSPSVSGITCVEVVGDTNQMIANSNIASYGGAWLLVQFLGATNSSTTTLIPTAPADNAAVGMTIRMDGSSVTIDGI